MKNQEPMDPDPIDSAEDTAAIEKPVVENSAGDEAIDANSANDVSDPDVPTDDGPGWLPAIMAATVLMGILGFIFCAFSTWLLFQRRTELATRTIRDAYLPELEQSYLDPVAKGEVVEVVQKLANDLEAGRYENWQSAGILQRLQRIPVLQWGRLTAVREFYAGLDDVDQDRIALVDRQMNRLKRGIDLDKLTSFDLQDVLEPVLEADPKSPSAYSLIQPLQQDAAEKVFDRVRLWLEQSGIPDESFDAIKIADVMTRAIQTGADKGTM